jgi:uncharacterized protein YecE (DUF72 family)
MAKGGRVFVGTSGWSYKDWRGRFYPQKLATTKWLGWYVEKFETTELNGPFYRTPSVEAVQRWREQSPPGFVFAWKASRFITHWKRLRPSVRSSLELLETRLSILGSHCGPVLFQLPANFAIDETRLRGFVDMLNRRRRYAFEFRHESWYCETVYRLLRRNRMALCISDHHDAPSPWQVTAPFVYIRAHGPGGRYKGHYPDTTLADWARHIDLWRRRGRDTYVYFDNDQKSAAPRDAFRLCNHLEGS